VADLISITCPSCDTHLRVPAAARGKNALCKKCGGKIAVPDEEPAPVAEVVPEPAAPAAFDFADEPEPTPARAAAPPLKGRPKVARRPAAAEDEPKKAPWLLIGGGLAAVAAVGITVAAVAWPSKKHDAPADGTAVAKADPKPDSTTPPAKPTKPEPTPPKTRPAATEPAVAVEPSPEPTTPADPPPAESPAAPKDDAPAPAEPPAPAATAPLQPVPPKGPKKKGAFPKGVAPKADPAPAPLAGDRKATTDRAKQSVALVKGKYGHGSGFLVAPNVVATNSHVVLTDLPDDITVQFMTDGIPDKPVKPRLLYEDKSRDLVLLLLPEDAGRPALPVAKGVKSADRPIVYVIGNPGQGGGVALALTVGEARVDEEVALIDGQPYYRLGFAPGRGDIRIGPGNSGGPAVDANGEVVGVLTLGHMGADGRPTGRSYLIPGKAVQDALDGLGPTAGWDLAAKKATSRHALDLYAFNLRTNAEVAALLIEVRVRLAERASGFNFAQLQAQDKEVTGGYQRANAKLKKIAQAAQKTILANGGLSPEQFKQMKAMENGLTLLQGTVGKGRFGTAEYKRAQATRDTVVASFKWICKDSNMSDEFVKMVDKALAAAILDE
jgi:S1-C subfamily serine protease